ncbi:MAG: class I SAM-dependent methyltransferase [Myxococcota bacterium]
MPDTYDRSLAHWSEEGRREMEAFYAVATKDYRVLAEAHDWRTELAATSADRRILDVACGSGKFPAALVQHAALDETPTWTVDLLDPSAFSIAEAARALKPPFVKGEELCLTAQALDPKRRYPLVWAVHGLYAVPAADLDLALERFVGAIAPGGLGFIAHARAEAHYLSFYTRYLERREGTPYATAEEIEATLGRRKTAMRVENLEYVGVVPADRPDVLEGYLQRCLFDESISLAAMRDDPDLGPYLASCRQPDGSHHFRQVVATFFLRN